MEGPGSLGVCERIDANRLSWQVAVADYVNGFQVLRTYYYNRGDTIEKKKEKENQEIRRKKKDGTGSGLHTVYSTQPLRGGFFFIQGKDRCTEYSV